ncbi:class I SAM-dependent methyltransferase [Rhodoblastus sp.]|uniref:class I SAM-dependent methyltransferase n=1 Tax=Rhodoblastus sp. TaxID=1962975 RepID=UPI003F9C2B7B
MLSLEKIGAKITLRNIWKRLVFRNVDFSNNYNAFRTAFLVEDPYGLRSASENYRFLETSRLIQANFPNVARLLEIGCAEGEQSRYLAEVCKSIKGIDVSYLAIARAKKACPMGIFSTGDIFSLHETFDLCVACEVLYYMKDINGTLSRMCQLGKSCMVTYWENYADEMDRHFTHIPDTNKAVIQYENTRWKAVWWTGRQFADS